MTDREGETYIQVSITIVFHVTSVSTSSPMRSTRRTTEVIKVLRRKKGTVSMNVFRNVPWGAQVDAHKEPSPKRAINPNFFCHDILRPITKGMGITMIMASVMTPRMAVAL